MEVTLLFAGITDLLLNCIGFNPVTLKKYFRDIWFRIRMDQLRKFHYNSYCIYLLSLHAGQSTWKGIAILGYFLYFLNRIKNISVNVQELKKKIIKHFFWIRWTKSRVTKFENWILGNHRLRFINNTIPSKKFLLSVVKKNTR